MTYDTGPMRAALAKATPGSLISQGWGDGSSCDGMTNIFNEDAEVLLMECLPEEDAALIVAAKNDLPAMLNTLDAQAAEIERLRADRGELLGALRKIMPIRCEDGLDYASIYFGGEGSHSTQAMTMNPQDWIDLEAILARAKIEVKP